MVANIQDKEIKGAEDEILPLEEKNGTKGYCYSMSKSLKCRKRKICQMCILVY